MRGMLSICDIYALQYDIVINAQKFEIWPQDITSIALSCGVRMRFDILNRSGVDHVSDRRTDGQNSDSNSAFISQLLIKRS